jgi:quercetin dioxygenase-like cupin family protein
MCKQLVITTTNRYSAALLRCGYINLQETRIMSSKRSQGETIWRRVTLAAAVAATVSIAATMANAGECPADKRVADGQGQKPSTAAAKDVTDVVRATTDLSKETLAQKGRLLRLRQLDVKPGGIVPWHSHDNRPAMIYIVSGEVVEYASNCAVPIVHKAGDVAAERKGTSHWWQNTGSAPVVLISVDLFPVDNMKDEHMM